MRYAALNLILEELAREMPAKIWKPNVKKVGVEKLEEVTLFFD
jgi:hypothetical protein